MHHHSTCAAMEHVNQTLDMLAKHLHCLHCQRAIVQPPPQHLWVHASTMTSYHVDPHPHNADAPPIGHGEGC